MEPFKLLVQRFNTAFQDWSPLQLFVLFSSTTLLFCRRDQLGPKNCTWSAWAFSCLLRTPWIGTRIAQKIDKEFEPSLKSLDKDLHKGRDVRYTALPQDQRTDKEVLEVVRSDCCQQRETEKRMSGAMYRYEDRWNLCDLNAEIAKMSSYVNPLHGQVYANVVQREAEVVSMCAQLFHGDNTICGNITYGGTFSIMEACRTHREWAREDKHITRPNMVVPISAHAAFDKAAQDYDIELRPVPVDPVTFRVDVNQVRRCIDRNTILLVGSAPSYATGAIDDIGSLSLLASEYNVGLHVDACLGGGLICFAEEAGIQLPLFDFRLPGVTSISLDTHKYFQTPKGSSVVLFRRRVGFYQPYVFLDWQGGMYITPNQAGSRCGATIMSTWGTMVRIGRQEYVRTAKDVFHLTRSLYESLRGIPNLKILCDPERGPQVSVVAFSVHEGNVYTLSDRMKHRGWHLNALQRPSAIHICVTPRHTENPNFVREFTEDITQCLEEINQEIKEGRASAKEGTAAVYGTLYAIPAMASSVVKKLLGRNYAYLNSRVGPTRCE